MWASDWRLPAASNRDGRFALRCLSVVGHAAIDMHGLSGNSSPMGPEAKREIHFLHVGLGSHMASSTWRYARCSHLYAPEDKGGLGV